MEVRSPTVLLAALPAAWLQQGLTYQIRPYSSGVMGKLNQDKHWQIMGLFCEIFDLNESPWCCQWNKDLASCQENLKRGREKRKDRPWQKSEKAEIFQCNVTCSIIYEVYARSLWILQRKQRKTARIITADLFTNLSWTLIQFDRLYRYDIVSIL